MYPSALIRLSFFSAILLLSPCYAAAELITFGFSGSVTSVEPELASEFEVGELITGYYTFESTTPPKLSSSIERAIYVNAITEFSATIGGDYIITDLGTSNAEDNEIIVEKDFYGVVIRSPSAPAVEGLLLTSLIFAFGDLEGNAFSSIELPLTPPDAEEFEFTLGQFLLFESPVKTIGIQITSFTIIPEPTTLTLATLALCLITTRRRR